MRRVFWWFSRSSYDINIILLKNGIYILSWTIWSSRFFNVWGRVTDFVLAVALFRKKEAKCHHRKLNTKGASPLFCTIIGYVCHVTHSANHNFLKGGIPMKAFSVDCRVVCTANSLLGPPFMHIAWTSNLSSLPGCFAWIQLKELFHKYCLIVKH